MKDRTESTIKAKKSISSPGLFPGRKGEDAGNEIAEEFGPSLTGKP